MLLIHCSSLLLCKAIWTTRRSHTRFDTKCVVVLLPSSSYSPLEMLPVDIQSLRSSFHIKVQSYFFLISTDVTICGHHQNRSGAIPDFQILLWKRRTTWTQLWAATTDRSPLLTPLSLLLFRFKWSSSLCYIHIIYCHHCLWRYALTITSVLLTWYHHSNNTSFILKWKSWWLENVAFWWDAFTAQVLSHFDNYLLTSVILVALAIILLVLYISCYAWVFRVSPKNINIILIMIEHLIQGNLDLPKPAKAFSIKGRLDSFKPARQGGWKANARNHFFSGKSKNLLMRINSIAITKFQSKLYKIHLAWLATIVVKSLQGWEVKLILLQVMWGNHHFSILNFGHRQVWNFARYFSPFESDYILRWRHPWSGHPLPNGYGDNI